MIQCMYIILFGNFNNINIYNFYVIAIQCDETAGQKRVLVTKIRT